MSSFRPNYKYGHWMGAAIQLDTTNRLILLRETMKRNERVFSFDDIRNVGTDPGTAGDCLIVFHVNDLNRPIYRVPFARPYTRDEWFSRLAAALDMQRLS